MSSDEFPLALTKSRDELRWPFQLESTPGKRVGPDYTSLLEASMIVSGPYNNCTRVSASTLSAAYQTRIRTCCANCRIQTTEELGLMTVPGRPGA